MILNVNSTFILLRAISIIAVSISLLNACGQRGPLYLPSKTEPAAGQPIQPANVSITTTTLPASK
ncbi:MAG: LPS translocon maturation chaperone LptM [Burkholderiaceae bacterium]